MAKIVSYLYRKSIAKPFLREGLLVRLEVPNEPGSLSVRRAVIFGSVATLPMSVYCENVLCPSKYLGFGELSSREWRNRKICSTRYFDMTSRNLLNEI